MFSTSLWIVFSILCINLSKGNPEILDSIVDESYDGRVRPHYQDSPTEVQVTMKIEEIENLDLDNQELKFRLEIMETWNDPRLDKGNSLLNSRKKPNSSFNNSENEIAIDDAGRVWTTGLYIKNARDLPLQKTVVKVNGKNGQVTKVTKLRISISCPMDFFYFPFDSQTCDFTVSSMEHSTQDLYFMWQNGQNSLNLPRDHSHSNLYQLKGFALSNGTKKGILEIHSKLEVKLFFARKCARNFPFFYFPALTLTMIAFFSLWMYPSIHSINISLISFITMIVFYVLIEEKTPTLMEMGMMDHYMFICLNLILNCVIVNMLIYGFKNPNPNKLKPKRKTSAVNRDANGKVEMKTFNGISELSTIGHKDMEDELTPEDLIYRMSKFKQFIYFKGCKPAKYHFPAGFLGINVIYWIWIFIVFILRFPSEFQRVA